VYYITSKDFQLYVDAQQEINFKIFEVFRQEAILFAYPTSIQYNKMPVSLTAEPTQKSPKKQKSDLDRINPVLLA
jgi:hypothetical protein